MRLLLAARHEEAPASVIDFRSCLQEDSNEVQLCSVSPCVGLRTLRSGSAFPDDGEVFFAFRLQPCNFSRSIRFGGRSPIAVDARSGVQRFHGSEMWQCRIRPRRPCTLPEYLTFDLAFRHYVKKLQLRLAATFPSESQVEDALERMSNRCATFANGPAEDVVSFVGQQWQASAEGEQFEERAKSLGERGLCGGPIGPALLLPACLRARLTSLNKGQCLCGR